MIYLQNSLESMEQVGFQNDPSFCLVKNNIQKGRGQDEQRTRNFQYSKAVLYATMILDTHHYTVIKIYVMHNT